MENSSVGFLRLSALLHEPRGKIYFSGIGGVGMYSLARMMLALGYRVEGSDRAGGPLVEKLCALGVRVHPEHAGKFVHGSRLLVYTLAVSPDNPELLYAASHGIPAVSRAELLGYLMLPYRERVGVAGSHGKSTVTAMLAEVFTRAGREPTVVCGADLPGGEPCLLGGHGAFLFEACEYRGSFLRFSPDVGLILNAEWDHTDCYPDCAALLAAFDAYAARARRLLILSADSPACREIASRYPRRKRTFGTSAAADYRYTVTDMTGGYPTLCLFDGADLCTCRLSVPGRHNAANAAAAFAAARECGIPAELAAGALSAFPGISRRMERVPCRFGFSLFYDYAHHPTEIAAAVSTLRAMSPAPLTVVFCPHTYSRTASLWDGFVTALSAADRVFLAPIFPARETPIPGITSEALAAAIGPAAAALPPEEIVTALSPAEGTVAVLGAGNLDTVLTALRGDAPV